ncbi:hypothetical protein CEUSTIGMA_g5273.t1 [Chlamydomonas eustigma]|uniref:Pentacotripeptide-repeat region of PRORP domain-containing protein n=1 Tax=Chlamydomonas eustigma TaxID=1157962 RepID=A0A250X4Z3_9CHLO|nr:hypothetical protein CEUSTIGMA_g5273.t1 [Chlamydomonas eustigma]|eukprot:GAX77830.1 hypothetical protein CEUSTIGMA_g5273.t1 [Chlamydomonas eustigma]
MLGFIHRYGRTCRDARGPVGTIRNAMQLALAVNAASTSKTADSSRLDGLKSTITEDASWASQRSRNSRRRQGSELARLSVEMEGFKRHLFVLLSSGRDKEAVHIFRAMMREGMEVGGGKGLPAPYCPDFQMLDEFYRALMRVHRLQEDVKVSSDSLHMDEEASSSSQQDGVSGSSWRFDTPQLGGSQQAAQQTASYAVIEELKEGLIWSKASGHVPGPSVYRQLIRNFRRTGQLEQMESTFTEMRAVGHLPNHSTYMNMALAYLEVGNLPKTWSILQPIVTSALNVKSGRIKSGAASFDVNNLNSLAVACIMTMRRAASSRSYEMVTDILSHVKALDVVVEASIFVDCVVAACKDNDLEAVEEFMTRLRSCTELVPKEKAEIIGSTDVPAKVSEGLILFVMRTALQAGDFEQGKRVAQLAFEVLQLSQGRPYLHPGDFYQPSVPLVLSLPSSTAYLGLLNACVRAKDWKTAFSVVHQLEVAREQLLQAVQGTSQLDDLYIITGDDDDDYHAAQNLSSSSYTAAPELLRRRVMSPLHGFRYFSEALSESETTVAAAYDELTARHARGDAVSTYMLNVILRALALVSPGEAALEATGRLFEEFTVAGLEHNADSYNAMIEACVGAKKLAAVRSVVDHMEAANASGDADVDVGLNAIPPLPNSDTWDLLLLALVGDGDCDGILVALQKLSASQVYPKIKTLRKALDVAAKQGHETAAATIRDVMSSISSRKYNHML